MKKIFLLTTLLFANLDAINSCNINNEKFMQLIEDIAFDYTNDIQATIEQIKLLLNQGADVNYKNEYGETALMLAIEEARNIKLVQILLEHNPNIDLTNQYGETALMLAIEQCDIEMINALLKHKPNLHIQDKNGYTALMIAELEQNQQIIEVLKLYEQNFCIIPAEDSI